MHHDKSWYQLPVEQVFDALKTSSEGLTSNESKARLELYGYNELKFKKRGPLIRFLMQFHSSLIYVLLFSALVTIILECWLLMIVVALPIFFIEFEKFLTPKITYLKHKDANKEGLMHNDE